MSDVTSRLEAATQQAENSAAQALVWTDGDESATYTQTSGNVVASIAKRNYEAWASFLGISVLSNADDYRVALKSSLPATVNSSGSAYLASVFGETGADAIYNGRYYQLDGSSTWVQIMDGISNRVSGFETTALVIAHIAAVGDTKYPDGHQFETVFLDSNKTPGSGMKWTYYQDRTGYTENGVSGVNGTIIHVGTNAVIVGDVTGSIDPRWFGVVSDVVTNAANEFVSGTDQTAAWQLVADYVNSLGGDAVEVIYPTGKPCRIDGTVAWGDKVKLTVLAPQYSYSDNRPVIFFHKPSAGSVDMFTFEKQVGSTGYMSVELTNVSARADQSAFSNHGLFTDDPVRIYTRNCYFEGFDRGALIETPITSILQNTVFTKCKEFGAKFTSASSTGTTTTLINCSFPNNFKIGCYVEKNSNLQISGGSSFESTNVNEDNDPYVCAALLIDDASVTADNIYLENNTYAFGVHLKSTSTTGVPVLRCGTINLFGGSVGTVLQRPDIIRAEYGVVDVDYVAPMDGSVYRGAFFRAFNNVLNARFGSTITASPFGSARANLTAYALGDRMVGSTGSNYTCITAGTTAASEPTDITNRVWTSNHKVTDGSVTWLRMETLSYNPANVDVIWTSNPSNVITTQFNQIGFEYDRIVRKYHMRANSSNDLEIFEDVSDDTLLSYDQSADQWETRKPWLYVDYVRLAAQRNSIGKSGYYYKEIASIAPAATSDISLEAVNASGLGDNCLIMVEAVNTSNYSQRGSWLIFVADTTVNVINATDPNSFLVTVSKPINDTLRFTNGGATATLNINITIIRTGAGGSIA